MISAAELAPFEGKRMDLEFTHGHVVRATLLSVDPHSPGDEIVYVVERVLVVGPPELGSVKPGAAAAADLSLLLKFTLVE